jgi:3-oxoadipate enol-lactonase
MGEASRVDLRDAARSIEAPTLVLCGERDRVNLPLSRELAALLPHGEFAVVPNAGHVANLDDPDAFSRLLRSFLDGA